MAFALHPTLAKDCVIVGDLALCRILLMNNQRFPWLILVPMREGLRDIHDIASHEYPLVMEEVRRTTQAFANHTRAYKMNVASLGNQVEQLHIHIVARHKEDPAWPNPVWNSGITPAPYRTDLLNNKLEKLRAILLPV